MPWLLAAFRRRPRFTVPVLGMLLGANVFLFAYAIHGVVGVVGLDGYQLVGEIMLGIGLVWAFALAHLAKD